MKTKLLKPERSGRWWIGCKDTKVDWVVKHKGDYWVIPGSEFPEKKITNKKETFRKKNNGFSNEERLYLYALILSISLGISLALNVIHYLIK
tara:strand:+ start:64 stop:339 length:276 start_codon:yes stop_codon:yes gene_type:complete